MTIASTGVDQVRVRILPDGWVDRKNAAKALNRTPKTLAEWKRLVDGFEQHAWQQEVRLWASPLDWLRADCDGLCILDWSAPEVFELARLPSVRCQDNRLPSPFCFCWQLHPRPRQFA